MTEPEHTAGLRARLAGRMSWREYGLPLALLVILLVGTFASPFFLIDFRTGEIRWGNIVNILVQSSVIGILAVGMTYVILTGGIDLSVGSVIGLAGVAAATFQDFGPPAMVVAGIATGFTVGVVNGLLVTVGRVVPFIATLAMLTIARGLALTLTGASPLRITERDFVQIGAGYLGGVIPYVVIIAAVAVFLGWFGLNRVTFGRRVYAVGGNREAARLSGIPVRRTIFLVYVISGLCAGIAAVLVTARTATAQPSAGQGYELDAIAAVVVGGVSLFGGRGSIVGTVFGVLILTIITNIFVLQNLSFDAQLVIKGVIILAAVMLQSRGDEEG
jgi:ribose transport system permease protein